MALLGLRTPPRLGVDSLAESMSADHPVKRAWQIFLCMTRRRSIAYLSLIIAACGLNFAFAKGPPTSAEQLRSELESVLKSKDTNALISLFDMEGADAYVMGVTLMDITEHAMQKVTRIAGVKVAPLSSILILQSYTNANLSLTLEAVNESSKRTASCLVNLEGGTTKEVGLLKGWILTPEDRVRVEITNPNYNKSQIYVLGCRTPSQSIAAQQEDVYRSFNRAQDQTEKDRAAQTLSDLWRAGLLKDQFKEELVQKHYQLVLRLNPAQDRILSWNVSIQETFPFPHVYTEFTPTLYSNDQVKWSPGAPQTTCAMNATNHQITSMVGGAFTNGEVLQCKIDLRQTDHGHSWQTSLWTGKVVIQGLKD